MNLSKLGEKVEDREEPSVMQIMGSESDTVAMEQQ